MASAIPENPFFQDTRFEHSGQIGNYAIIVPFRSNGLSDPRHSHLLRFQQLRFPGDPKIYIIEQTQGKKFNRGLLLNLGCVQAYKEIPGLTHVITHDVDLIPSEDILSTYAFIPAQRRPIHFARRFTRYAGDHSKNTQYIGGVVSFRVDDFLQINGYPNKFWGWGGEDDELSRRIRVHGFDPVAPSFGTYTDLECMSLREKVHELRTGTARCTIKHELLGDYADGTVRDGVRSLSAKDVAGIAREDSGCFEKVTKITKITVDVFASSGHPSDLCSDQAYSEWGYPGVAQTA